MKNPNGVNRPVTESGVVTNLSDQDMCFCGRHVSLIDPTKEPSFLCYHCDKRYHTDCMKREKGTRTCTFCHLRRLVPNRQTKKVLFVGLLQKGRKRHEVHFPLAEEDNSSILPILVNLKAKANPFDKK